MEANNKLSIYQINLIKQNTSTVIIDHQIYNHIKKCLSQINIKNSVIITENNVKEKVLPKIQKELALLTPLSVLIFPPGERSKTNKIKTNLEKSLSSLLANKNTAIIAIGGGVVTDLAGFIAATYYRGLPLINIPTSLIGMIDASLGGKVGINTTFGKNILGCIKHPLLTVINPYFLETLPKKELINGLIEALKYSVIASPQLFDFMYKHQHILTQPTLNINLLKLLIQTCCQIKLHIVEQDPEDMNIRKTLNFGHTTAHALEFLSQYQMSHGEAVAIGMRVAILLSYRQGYLDLRVAQKILSLINVFYKKKKLNFSITSIKKAMLFDKKSNYQDICFVLLKNLGEVMSFNKTFCSSVPESMLDSVLQDVLNGSL